MKWVAALALVYEAAALASSGRLPTYSHFLRTMPPPWGPMIVGAFTSWLYWHIFIEGRGVQV